jgi:hypothetical protein
VEKSFPLLREYAVFNASQCDGAERFQLQPADTTTAASAASKGADVILSFSHQPQPEEERVALRGLAGRDSRPTATGG